MCHHGVTSFCLLFLRLQIDTDSKPYSVEGHIPLQPSDIESSRVPLHKRLVIELLGILPTSQGILGRSHLCGSCPCPTR